MYETAMDQVRQEIDEVYNEVEKISLLVEHIPFDSLKDSFDVRISRVMRMLEKI